jgi:hypothetical protein
MAEVVLLSKERGKIEFKKTNILVAVLAAVYAFWAIFGSGKEIIFYTAMLLLSSVILYAWLYWRMQKA